MAQTSVLKGPEPSKFFAASGLLQRKCACGQHTTAGGQCGACREKREGRLQRAAVNHQEPQEQQEGVPLIVHDVLSSPGQPLDRNTRSLMETRLGHDFSRVQAQSGRLAQKSNGELSIGSAADALELEADSMAERFGRVGRVERVGQAVRAGAEERAGQGGPPGAYDLSRVRVHTDARAAESARAIGASAYTVGHDVVFGAGQYAPSSARGQALLAHELTHVAQQRSAGGLQRKVLQRKGGTVGGFFKNIGRGIASFFGKEVGFDEGVLQKYLTSLDETGDIEDDYDSDDKARAIALAWRLGGSPYVLTAQRKALMIREMQKGVTGDDDEVAILEILERSYNFELGLIFGVGGVRVKDLNSDFHGDEWARLQDFYGRRFDGGMEAMLKGNLKPVGLPVALGEALPIMGNYMVADLKGATSEWNVACVLGILCPLDKAVVQQLPKLTVQKADTVTEVYWEFDGTTWVMKTRDRAAFSSASEGIIGLKTDATCYVAAQNIIHEVRHQNQPATWTKAEKERDAYTFEEDWLIQRGLPGRSRFRTTKPDTGEVITDVPAIEQYVADKYSGAGSTAGEVIVGHTATGEAEIEQADGTPGTRPAAKGESHQDVEKTKANLSNLPKVDPKEWVCPEKTQTK